MCFESRHNVQKRVSIELLTPKIPTINCFGADVPAI